MNRADRATKLLLALLAAGVWGLLLRPLFVPASLADEPAKKGGQRFDEITVQRINLVDPGGKVRLVISNANRFPNPVVKGKEYERSIKPAGIVFYKADGDECGGIALNSTPKGEHVVFAFDYANSEAIGMSRSESKDGKNYDAGLVILDRVPLDADIEKVGSVGTRRFEVSNEDKNCKVILADPKGKERIVLGVDAAGEARLQIFDKDGKVVFAAPK